MAGQVLLVTHDAKSVVEPSPVRAVVGKLTVEFAHPPLVLQVTVSVYVCAVLLDVDAEVGVIETPSAAYAVSAFIRPSATRPSTAMTAAALRALLDRRARVFMSTPCHAVPGLILGHTQ